MDRLAMTGFTLTILGAMGIVASDLVGTALAGRDPSGTYIAALSSGTALRLLPANSASRREARDPTDAPAPQRHLQCQRLMDAGAFSIGMHCRTP